MEKRSIVLIANPHAGRGDGARREREIKIFCETLAKRGVDVEVRSTLAPHDATRLTAEAVREGASLVIVSGGDGTINEALQSIVGSNVELAVWPRGTANVLAHELRLPFDAVRAAEMIARGNTRAIYAGCAIREGDNSDNTDAHAIHHNNPSEHNARRYFLLMAGIGLDASVVERVQPRLKRRVGKAAFWYSGLEHLTFWQPRLFKVEVDGESHDATFAAIGKAAHYGGGLSVTPRADLTKPEFEMCVVGARNRFRFLYLLAHTLRAGGVPASVRDVRFVRATHIRATGDASVQADGELIGRLPMRFEIIPQPIKIVVP